MLKISSYTKLFTPSHGYFKCRFDAPAVIDPNEPAFLTDTGYTANTFLTIMSRTIDNRTYRPSRHFIGGVLGE